MFVVDGRPGVSELLSRNRENGCWSVCATVTRWENGSKVESELIVENGTLPVLKEIKMSEQFGQVGVSRGLTLNLGNFQSARIDAWASLPTATSDADLDASYNRCELFVNSKVEEAAEKVRAEMK